MCLINANRNNNNNNNNNTKDSDKSFTQFPSEEIPRKMHRLHRSLGKSPKNYHTHTKKKKRTMNKHKMYIKNQRIQNVYKFFIFPSDILQKVDVNQMNPT